MKQVELADVLIIAGLGGLGYGLWLYDPRVSYATIGFIVFSMGLLRYLRQ